MPKTPRWASLPQTAKYTGMHIDTIRRRIKDGRIQAYRFGPRLVRIDLNEIDAMMRPLQKNSSGHAA
jgi:excisionase family DNA binding protein